MAEDIQYKSEIDSLKIQLEKIDEPPIDMSSNVEKLISSLNEMQAMMGQKEINNNFKDVLINAREAGEQVNAAFGCDKGIKEVEEKINLITDPEAKKKSQDYFKKNLPFIGLFKDPEKTLENEVKEIKNLFYKNKEQHPAEFYELATSLKEFPNLPNINAVFMDLEGLAFSNKKEQINKVLQSLDKVSTIIQINLNRFTDEKLTKDKINEIFKEITGKTVIELFTNKSGLVEASSFEKELKETDDGLKKIAEMLENYRDIKYKPVYKKLSNFYWNAMAFYETLGDELEHTPLAQKIEAYGEELVTLRMKYEAFYNPDEINKIVQYINKKIDLFNEIYHINYQKILNNYQKILNFIENKNEKTGIKNLILKIVNAELNKNQEGQNILEEIKQAKELLEDFNGIDHDNNDELQEYSIPENEFQKIEEDIDKRLEKIVLIDENSRKLFDEVDEFQKDIIEDVNEFVVKVKGYWENDGSLNSQEIRDIKNYYKLLILSLKNLNDKYHNFIIKNYRINLSSIKKFIDNFDLMYDLKNKIDSDKLKKLDKEIIPVRFDFAENDLDRLINNEKMRKQTINEYMQKPENIQKLKEALETLKRVKIK